MRRFYLKDVDRQFSVILKLAFYLWIRIRLFLVLTHQISL